MERTETTVDDAIDQATYPTGLRRLHETLLAAMAPTPVVVWEGTFWGGSDQRIIGYGEHRYARSDGREVEWFHVGLAEQQHGFSVYANGVEDGAYLTEQYRGRLGKAKVGKAAITFSSADSIDLDALAELARHTKASFA
jgi:hypothetical protein